MTSTEHKDLAAFIKSIHSNLRKKSQIYGPDEAWKRHVAERETLQRYAESMHILATKHWAENVADPNKNTKCRIDWVKSQCWEYFFRGGTELYLDREVNIKQKMMTNRVTVNGIQTYQEISGSDISYDNKEPTNDTAKSISEKSENGVICSGQESIQAKQHTAKIQDSLDGNTSTNDADRLKTSRKNRLLKRISGDILNNRNTEISKVKLLDVGSCYNPFGHVEYFDVTAIDLAPSCDEVLQCDFLSLEVGRENLFSQNKTHVVQLETDSFDTIVFCLLLEYLPSPEQRYSCCKKAYNLLKNGGLLLIITPDSKHVGANARFMKSWRHVLSHLGFMRIKYEKLPHAHCLAFRKCFYKEVATRWAGLQKFSKDDQLFRFETKMFIPQDFTTVIKEETVVSVLADEYTAVNLYNELPYT